VVVLDSGAGLSNATPQQLLVPVRLFYDFLVGCRGGVGPGKVEHLVGHVQAVCLAGRANPAGRQQHVDAAPRAKIQDGLALPEISDGERVTAAQAGGDGLLGQFDLLSTGILPGACPSLVRGGGRLTAGGDIPVSDGRRGTGVPVAYPLAHCL
jgi:hypothetical protein